MRPFFVTFFMTFSILFCGHFFISALSLCLIVASYLADDITAMSAKVIIYAKSI